MGEEIQIKEDEGINFLLWIIFLCLLGSGAIFISAKQPIVGFPLFLSAFGFWFIVYSYSKHKRKTIKTTETHK